MQVWTHPGRTRDPITHHIRRWSLNPGPNTQLTSSLPLRFYNKLKVIFTLVSPCAYLCVAMATILTLTATYPHFFSSLNWSNLISLYSHVQLHINSFCSLLAKNRNIIRCSQTAKKNVNVYLRYPVGELERITSGHRRRMWRRSLNSRCHLGTVHLWSALSGCVLIPDLIREPEITNREAKFRPW